MKGLKIGRALACMALIATVAGAATAQAAPAGPDVVAQGAMHLTLPAEDVSITSVVLDFAPGAQVPEHVHGGPLVVTVLSGEITLNEDGGTKVYKPGESWSEMPGHPHSAINAGSTMGRVVVTALLTKGAELQTLTDNGAKQANVQGPTAPFQAAYPISIPAEEADLVNLVLSFPPGAGVPDHVHGGPLIVQVLSGEITLTENGGSQTYKAGQMWTETAGHVHNAFNNGSSTTQVLVSALIPKGAQLQTIVGQTGGAVPAGMPSTGSPQADWPGWVALLALVILAAGSMTRLRAARR